MTRRQPVRPAARATCATPPRRRARHPTPSRSRATSGSPATATFAAPLEISDARTNRYRARARTTRSSRGVRARTRYQSSTRRPARSSDRSATTPMRRSPSRSRPTTRSVQFFGCAAPGARIVAVGPGGRGERRRGLRLRRARRRPDRGVGRAAGARRRDAEGRARRQTARRRSRSPTASAPTELELATSRRATAPPSTPATRCSSSTPASSGRTAPCSTRAGRTAASGVVPDDRRRRRLQAGARGPDRRLAGARGRSRPALGLRRGRLIRARLAGETLVFVVDILGTQHAAAPPSSDGRRCPAARESTPR